MNFETNIGADNGSANKPEEKTSEQRHKEVVDSGRFDKIPEEVLSVGDLIITKKSPFAYKILEINGDLIIAVTKNRQGEDVQEEFKKEDVRSISAMVSQDIIIRATQ